MTDQVPQRQNRPLVGILLVVAAVTAFALGDTCTKYLTERQPVPIVMAARYLITIIILMVFLAPRQGKKLWHTNRTGLVIVRGACLATASLCVGLALSRMPLGETVAIVYLAPLALLVLAGPVLGEKVSIKAYLATMMGFVGVLLIVRPGGGLDALGIFFALICAAVSTIYHLLSRLLGRTETTTAMQFHTAWVGSALFCVLAIPYLSELNVNTTDMLLMLVLGLLTTAGHFMLTAAYKEADAAFLAPINYLHLVGAGIFGWIFFGHIPGIISTIGMGMVCVAGVAVAVRTRTKPKMA